MADEGHNSQLTDAERKALQFDHFRKMKQQKAKLDVEREEYKRIRGLAKADGFKLADMDFMLKCSEIEDPDIIPGDLKRQMEIAAWFNLPVAYQPDLFADRAPHEEKVSAAGYKDGIMGVTADSGYPKGSTEDNLYMEGWTKGQKEQAEALQAAMDKKLTAAADEAAEKEAPMPMAEEGAEPAEDDTSDTREGDGTVDLPPA